MESRKNGVACTITRVIQINNAFSRRVAVNVTIVLLLVVDERNSEEHEIYVVDSTTVDCKLCCLSNGKIVKKSNESDVEYSPPPGIGFSFYMLSSPALSSTRRVSDAGEFKVFKTFR